MLKGLLVILIGVVLAQMFRVLREIQAREAELKAKLKRRARLQEELRQTTDAVAIGLDDLTAAVARVEAELDEERAALDACERQYADLTSRDLLDVIVFDRLALSSEHLWEVDISNAQAHELASAKLAPAGFVEQWKLGRCYLVGASTEGDARSRCAARYPASLGYHVDDVRRFRGLMPRTSGVLATP